MFSLVLCKCFRQILIKCNNFIRCEDLPSCILINSDAPVNSERSQVKSVLFQSALVTVVRLGWHFEGYDKLLSHDITNLQFCETNVALDTLVFHTS